MDLIQDLNLGTRGTKSLMESSNVATATGSSSNGVETGPQAKQPQMVGGNETFNKVQICIKRK